MAQYHVYSQTVADGTATSVVRPSDWNSAHNLVQTISGNTAGQSTVSGTNIVYHGGNNVTLSAQTAAGAATIVFSAANDLTSGRAGTGFTSTTTAGTAVVGTLNTNGLSMGVPAYITTFQNDLTSGRAGTGFTTTTAAGAVVAGTLGTNGLNLAVPSYLTTAAQSNHSHGNPTLVLTNLSGTTASASNGLTLSISAAAQSAQTQPAGNIAGVGTTFNGTNVSASITLNSNGLNLALSGQGGGVVNQTGPNIAAGTQTATSGTVIFSNSNGVTFGLDGQTLTASVNAGGGGATESNFMPHLNALWAPAQVGQNSIQVQPICNAPLVTYNHLAYGVQFTQATNSTMTVSCTVHMGVYSMNGSTLSQITSHSGSFSINGSGTASSSANSGPRWATMSLNAGGTISGDVWIAFKSSTATAGVNATLSNIVASRINSSWSGVIGQGTANSNQSLPGMGFYSATSSALPNSMAVSHITGISSTAQRPQIFFLTNGGFPF